MRISDWSSDVCSSDLGAVCADGHLRAEPFDLAGGAMDRWPVRLALGVLADSSSGRHCCLADRVGSAERPDPDRPFPAGQLARYGFRRAGIRPDYRRLGSGRAAGLVQFTPHRRLAGGWADASGGLSADGVVSPGAVHQVADRSEEHTSELQSLM